MDIFFSCTGSKRYFKAAEKLEKQGLVNEAAEFYLESLKRNYKNTQARIKLKEVGQNMLIFYPHNFLENFQPTITTPLFKPLKKYWISKKDLLHWA